MPSVAKEFRYAIGLDRAGRLTADGTSRLDLDDAWTPEHLMLAGLARCTLQSLRFHADRIGIDFLAEVSASGVVTKRADDGRYAFVELDVEIDLELEPAPAARGTDRAAREGRTGLLRRRVAQHHRRAIAGE